MPTYWLSASGNDANDGTSYAQAKATLAAGLGLIATGDTLNVANDGDHLMLNTDYLSGGPGNFDGDVRGRGTSWTNFGFRVRGVTPAGVAAMARIKSDPGTNCEYGVVSVRDLCAYGIIENIIVDFRPSTANSATLYGIIGYGTSCWPIRILHCEFIGADIGAAKPAGARRAYAKTAGPSHTTETDGVLFRYCVFTNLSASGGLSQDLVFQPWVLHRCLFFTDANEANEFSNISILGDSVGGIEALNVTHCTFYHKNEYSAAKVQTLINVNTTNMTDITVHSNVVYVNPGASVYNGTWVSSDLFENDSVGFLGTGTRGTVGYNVIALGPNVPSAGSWTTAGIYDDCFHTQPATFVNTTVWATDEMTFVGGPTALFNATSAWTWTVEGIDHNLPIDARISMFRTSGEGGSVPGAVDEAINTAPVATNVTYTADTGVTLSVTAGDGVLSGVTDVDLDTLTASVVASPTHGTLDTFNTTTGAFAYTPNNTYAGTDTFTFKAWDGTTFSNTSSAIIDVVNTPPVGSNKTYSTPENNQLSVVAASGLLAGATDINNQTVSVTNVATPTYGAVTFNTTTGSFVYMPSAFFVGTDSFTFTLWDGMVDSTTYTATISVQGTTTPSITNVVDTAPFFQPTLRVSTEFRIKTTKNRTKYKDLSNYTKEVRWEESTHRVLNLATNTTQQVTLGGVADAEYLVVETDHAIDVSINDASRYWPVTKVVALALTSATTVYLRNNSNTNTAQVFLVVVD